MNPFLPEKISKDFIKPLGDNSMVIKAKGLNGKIKDATKMRFKSKI